MTGAVHTERPLNVVIVVGLEGTNGWAAPVRGEPTLFLAVERLPEPGFDTVLALHEASTAQAPRTSGGHLGSAFLVEKPGCRNGHSVRSASVGERRAARSAG